MALQLAARRGVMVSRFVSIERVPAVTHAL